MTTFATPDGTKKYAARFAARAAAGHFREQQTLWLSSLGIGTYLGEADARTDKAYTDAIVEAVESGVNVIDSAINYRFQRSERSVGAALAELARRGYSREELLICTKGGFLTPDGDMPADAGEYFNREYVETGILRRRETWPPVATRWRRDSLPISSSAAAATWASKPSTSITCTTRKRNWAKCRARCSTAACAAAFEFLESAVAAAKIHFYGMATWNAFRQSENDAGFSFAGSDGIACARRCRRVAPFSIRAVAVQPGHDGSAHALEPGSRRAGVPMVEAGNKLGITLVASAAMLQGKLSRGLPPFVTAALGMKTMPSARCSSCGPRRALRRLSWA